MARASVCNRVPIAAGVAGLAALRRATRPNPWFAVVSGVVHGGEVSYESAQATGEFLAEYGAERLQTEADVAVALRDPSLPPGAGRGITVVADRIAAAARAYVKYGSKASARTRPAMDRLTYAVCNECRPRGAAGRAIEAKMGPAAKTGIGRKAGALMREYLGDDDAVAVDRHVFWFVYQHTGRAGVARVSKEERDLLARRPGVKVVAATRAGGAPRLFYETAAGAMKPLDVRPWQRGDQIGPAEFAFGEKIVRELAKECGVSAAALQVAVWLQSACSSKGRGVNYSLPLTRGKFFRCADVLDQRTLPGLDGALAGLGALQRRLARVGPRRLVVLENGRVVTA